MCNVGKLNKMYFRVLLQVHIDIIVNYYYHKI